MGFTCMRAIIYQVGPLTTDLDTRWLVACEQSIVKLKVSVDHLIPMAVVDRIDNLPKEVPRFILLHDQTTTVALVRPA